MVTGKEITEKGDYYRKKNGNDKILTDDMLFYIIDRIDNLPCMEHLCTISELSGVIKVIVPVMLAGFASIIGLIYYLG